MEKRSSLKQINRRYHKGIKNLTKGGHERDILEALSRGKNTYLRLDRLESSSFDSTWIDVIEDVIFDLGEIIANPRLNTKTEGNIVPVELARKTGAESVQHLASHTQYVKEIDDYGNVIPSKILTMVHEDDIRTYENRFIATLVRRLVLFVEKRYEIVSEFAELHDEEVLMFKNKSFVDGATVEIETKIKINHKSDDELSLKSNAYVKRIEEMRRYLLYFYNSAFMKQLRTERDVHNPIIMTNIIKKNPKYHHCYEVYKFIERYEQLGVNYRVDENYSLFSEEEMQELNHTLFANYITLCGKDRSKNAKVDSRVYKPKILTSIDDESFIYGPLLSGPIEFVRKDALYQEYLDSKLRKDLPLHPTKKEKEYYEDEYAAKAENKEDQKQKDNLIKRVEKGVKAFEKQAAKIDEEREQARLALIEQEKQVIKQEEDEALAQAREELVATSLAHKEAEEKARRKKEKEFLASIKPAQVPVKMSHPRSKPVTYDQAVIQVWPQLKEKPVKKDAPTKEEAPIIEETPVVETPVEEAIVVNEPTNEPIVEEEIKEAVVPTPMSHPTSKAVSYDEAVLDIWPILKEEPIKKEEKKAPSKAKAAKKAEPKVVEQPKETKEEEIKPAVIPTPMSHPMSEPVSYDQAVTQIWPQLLNVPEKKEPAPKKVEKPAKKVPSKKAPAKKKEPKVETPKVEPKKEAPKAKKATPKKVKEEPVKETPKEKKEEKKPVKKAVKPAPKKVEEPKPTPKPAKKAEPKPVKKEEPREKIPGRFIVKTAQGYYVNKNKLSINKDDAKIFDDFNEANDIKKALGGKVVKL